MTYRVQYSPEVANQIAGHVDWLLEQGASTTVINGWFQRLFDEVDDLYEMPRRHPVAER